MILDREMQSTVQNVLLNLFDVSSVIINVYKSIIRYYDIREKKIVPRDTHRSSSESLRDTCKKLIRGTAI